MRKRRIYVIGAVALAVAVAVAGIAYAATAVQTTKVKYKPSTLDKKKYEKVKYDVTVDTQDADDPDAVPPDADETRLLIDNSTKFVTKGIPQCDKASIENTTTEQAKQECGDAQVGAGEAVVDLPSAGGTLHFNAVVTAFNGEPAAAGRATASGGGSPTIHLHSRVTQLSTTVILTGTLEKIKQGDFGYKLTVPIEDIAGGAGGIRHFQTAVGKGFVNKPYARARCNDSNKKLDLKVETDFSDAPTTTATASQKCKVG